MPGTDDLDAMVASDTETLLGVARALGLRVRPTLWPLDHVAALAGALGYDGTDPVEAHKAAHLSTHLFGDGPPPALLVEVECPTRRCDRVRADLAGMVPAGGGLHLVGPADTAPATSPNDATPATRVTYAAALGVVSDLVATHASRLGTDPGLVVMVGGTALAAHGARAASDDVDLHMPEQDDAVVAEVEARHAAALGPAFRLDVTPSDTLWGRIGVRDIGSMPVMATVDAAGYRVPVRALDLPTLYVLKAAANRPKDVRDLRAIAPMVEPAALLARAAAMVGWYGDRARIVGFLDALVDALGLDLSMEADEVEAALGLQGVHVAALAAHRATRARRRALADAAAARQA